MTDLAERGSLSVRELQPPLQLCLQDAVFGGQIFISQQQLLVHRPGDVGQDARPIHKVRLSAVGTTDRPQQMYRTNSSAATPTTDNFPSFLQFQFFDQTGWSFARSACATPERSS